MTIATVDKLNKGTSRDQWGVFGHWGFKTSNGLIRSRVMSDGHLTVKLFDPANIRSYRKTMTWDEALTLGSSYVEIPEADTKGPDSKSMVPEVNAIIEGYNDTLAKWSGKHILNAGNSDDKEGVIVTTVVVDFDANATMNVSLCGHRQGYTYNTTIIPVENAREVTTSIYASQLNDALETQRNMIRTAQSFLMEVDTAVATGASMKEIENYSGSKGSIGWSEAKKIVDFVNKLATDTPTVVA